MILELLTATDAILDRRVRASSPSSPKVEKAKGKNLYLFSSHLAVYFFRFRSAAFAKETLGAQEETHVPAKGELPVTSTQASLP